MTLVAGLGDVDSAAPSWSMWDMSRIVKGSPDLTAAFDAGLDWPPPSAPRPCRVGQSLGRRLLEALRQLHRPIRRPGAERVGAAQPHVGHRSRRAARRDRPHAVSLPTTTRRRSAPSSASRSAKRPPTSCARSSRAMRRRPARSRSACDARTSTTPGVSVRRRTTSRSCTRCDSRCASSVVALSNAGISTTSSRSSCSSSSSSTTSSSARPTSPRSPRSARPST